MKTNQPQSLMPHHKLIAYQLAFELVQLIGKMRIADANLRAQARLRAERRERNHAGVSP